MGLLRVRDLQVRKPGCFPKPLPGQVLKLMAWLLFNEVEDGQVALPGYFWNNRRVAEDTSAMGRGVGLPTTLIR